MAWLGLVVTLGAVIRWRSAAGPGGDAADYLNAARDLTGASRFPVGFPALLAVFGTGVCLVIALALVSAIWWAAVRVGGWWAGALAAPLMLLSPGVTSGGSAVMSDRLGALLIVCALIALLYARPILAGVLIALSGWVRLVHVAFVAALPRRAWPPAAIVVGLLVAWQVGVKGSLFGYTSDSASFALNNIIGPVWLEHTGQPAEVTNLVYFPAVLMAGFGAQLMPLLVVPAVLGLRRHWSPAARFAAGVIVLNVVVYLPYFFQSARFVLPAGCLLTVYAAGLAGAEPVAGQGAGRVDRQAQVVHGGHI